MLCFFVSLYWKVLKVSKKATKVQSPTVSHKDAPKEKISDISIFFMVQTMQKSAHVERISLIYTLGQCE